MNYKNIIIIIAIACCIAAVRHSIFSAAGYAQKIESLRSQNSALEENRKRLSLEFAKLKKELAELEEREAVLVQKILLQAAEIEEAKMQADKSQSSLNKLQQELNKTRKKIEELEKSPANRDGDELLNSLKIKTKI
jgi:chromosome segregation ATPase